VDNIIAGYGEGVKAKNRQKRLWGIEKWSKIR
jgi:hypothetical protein